MEKRLFGVCLVGSILYMGSYLFIRQGFVLKLRHQYKVTSERLTADNVHSWEARSLLKNEGPKWLTLWVPSDLDVDISHLTEIPGWKTVVVGDGLCPRGCRYPSCMFLDSASQTALGSSLSIHLPRDQQSRRNLAYLYAIRQQAEYIYDADVNIRPLHNLTDFIFSNTTGLVYIGGARFNHFQHFGEYWFSPKGGATTNEPSGYVLLDVGQPQVQVGLIRKDDGSGPRFESSAPSVFIGSQSSASFENKNILFTRQAFWGLYLLPESRGGQIRNTIVQLLLKYINGFVAFLPPNAIEGKSSAEAYSGVEITDTSQSFVSQWKCNDSLNLGNCFELLISDLLVKNIINKQELLLWKEWISDLQLFGYKDMVNLTRPPQTIERITNKGNKTILSPSPGVYYHYNPDSHAYDQASTICPSFIYPKEIQTDFSHILLIVTFNYASLYPNVQFLQAIHGRYFPNILYCGPDFQNFSDIIQPLSMNSTVMFVTGVENGWTMFHECMVCGMKLNLNVKGYLQIGDDTLLNPWNMVPLPKHQMWYLDFFDSPLSRNSSDTQGWQYWRLPLGMRAFNKTFEYIKTKSKEIGPSKEKQFYYKYINNVGNDWTVNHQMSDLFYIPNRLKAEFIYFATLFIGVNVEATIPTIIFGLDPKVNIKFLHGNIFCRKGFNNNPEKIFNASLHFMHPFKGKSYMAKDNCRKFMCDTFLPTMVNRMSLNVTNVNNQPTNIQN